MEKIRRICEADFPNVSRLFDLRKSVEELKWLYRNPDNPQEYNAFVAIDHNNNLIGVQAFISSVYSLNDTELVGIFPMTWKVADGYRGMAGLLLAQECFKQGDFSLSIGGSEFSLRLYPFLKINHISNARIYFRLFSNKSLYVWLRNQSIYNIFGSITLLFFSKLSCLRNKVFLSKEVRLIPYDGQNFIVKDTAIIK